MNELTTKIGIILTRGPKTKQLIEAFLNYDDDLPVEGITNSSKEVKRNFIFVAVKGENFDGHDFAQEAVDNGASILLVERQLNINVCQLIIQKGLLRVALAEFAGSYYNFPFEKLTTVGITGTNGKTSVSSMVKALLEYNGIETEIIGTLTSQRTTPEAHTLNDVAYRALKSGKKALVMEVSSIGLSLGRVDGIVFDVAAFTNISHEHLDFHKTMEDYYLAKKTLFFQCDTAVIFQKDIWSERLIDELTLETKIKIETVSHLDATNIVPNLCGTSFKAENEQINLNWGGIFTVDNALLAFQIGLCLNIPKDKAALGISSCPQVKGRFEMVREPTHLTPLVVVDYAHTPDALKAALVSAKIVAKDKVVVVFGCGGDRDVKKRPEMGKVATELADLVIITNDNPRSEDPQEIVSQIVSEIEHGQYQIELDRAKAIENAISLTNGNDVVLIAGKGHENYQIFKDQTISFSDVEVAAKLVENRNANEGSTPITDNHSEFYL